MALRLSKTYDCNQSNDFIKKCFYGNQQSLLKHYQLLKLKLLTKQINSRLKP